MGALKPAKYYVDKFAKGMLKELKDNEHKGEWRDWENVSEISIELDYHREKLHHAIVRMDFDKIKEHAHDCGNFLMILTKVYEEIEIKNYQKGGENRGQNQVSCDRGTQTNIGNKKSDWLQRWWLYRQLQRIFRLRGV